MVKRLFGLAMLMAWGIPCVFGQADRKTQKIIVITLDGYRWQEVFTGADEKILEHQKLFSNPAASRFWHPDTDIRKKMLMPFFWEVLARNGQLYGNRNFNNKVNCKNNHLLSYPGYHEMFVGYPERKISGNDRIVNPNPTVFEFINKELSSPVAAFTTWDVFPFILREDQSGIMVNAGKEPARGKISALERHLNVKLQSQRRTDLMTVQYAWEYMKRERPNVVFIGLDETDHFAHKGKYTEYLNAAHTADSLIAEIWNWVQQQTDYRNQTTLLITTDHGRGKGKRIWKNHRLMACGSRHIWFAAIGPDTPAFGEMRFKAKYFQKQVAKTIAAFLGLQYENKEPVGEAIQTMLAVPPPILERETLSGALDR